MGNTNERYYAVLAFNSTHRVASDDFYVGTDFYRKAIQNIPNVGRRIEGGRQFPDDITLEIDNSDGSFSASEDYRRKPVFYGSYNMDTSTAKSLVTGKVSSFEIGTTAKFVIKVQDPDIFASDFPLKVFEEEDWASHPDGDPNDEGDEIYTPTIDLGKPYPIAFGEPNKVTCVFVYENMEDNYYDYIASVGPIESINAVYVNGVTASPSEYEWHDGTQVDGRYTGYAYIRFTKNQRDYSGNYYEVTADIDGLLLGGATANRNYAEVLSNILGNSDWGLGQPINTASFVSAGTTLANLYCDYGLDYKTKPNSLQDLIDILCFCARATLIVNSVGNWEIVLDDTQSGDPAYFGLGDGYRENIIEIKQYGFKESSNDVKNHIVKYRWNSWSEEYECQLTRVVNEDFGEDVTVKLPCVINHETADRINGYYQKKYQASAQEIVFTVGTEGEDLAYPGLVNIIYQYKSWDKNSDQEITIDVIGTDDTGVDFQIVDWKKDGGEYEVRGILYDSDVYVYDADPNLPSSPYDPPDIPDYSKTQPSAPLNFHFQVMSSGVNIGGDGSATTYVVLSADPNDVEAFPYNFAKIMFGYKDTIQGATVYTYQEGDPVLGTRDILDDTWKITITGLVPGHTYDLIATAVNSFELRSVPNEDTVITSWVAPGDSGAPAVPGTPTATQTDGRTISIDWADNSEDDLAGYDVYRNTVNNSGTATKIAQVDASRFVDQDSVLSFGSTYYYWIKAFDYSGNRSGFSNSDSVTLTKIGGGSLDPTSGYYFNTGGFISFNGATIWMSAGTMTFSGTSSISFLGATVEITAGTFTVKTSGKISVQTSSGIEVLSSGGITVLASSGTGAIDIKNDTGGSAGLSFSSTSLDSQVIFYNLYLDSPVTQMFVIDSTGSWAGITAFIISNFDTIQLLCGDNKTFGITSSSHAYLGSSMTDFRPLGSSCSLGTEIHPWNKGYFHDMIYISGSGTTNAVLQLISTTNSYYSLVFYQTGGGAWSVGMDTPSGSHPAAFHWWWGSTLKAYLTNDGDLYLNGTTYNYGLSIDIEDGELWDLHDSIKAGFKSHNAKKFHPKLIEIKKVKTLDKKEEEERAYYCSNDLIQVLIECVDDLKNRIEVLEK